MCGAVLKLYCTHLEYFITVPRITAVQASRLMVSVLIRHSSMHALFKYQLNRTAEAFFSQGYWDNAVPCCQGTWLIV